MARAPVRPSRWRCAAGIAGPALFVAAWAVLGARRAGYDPVHDPISRLAALGAATRPAMTAGFVAFSAGVGAYVPVLRSSYGPGVAGAATVTAAGTAAVALLPLGSGVGDGPHAVAAGVAYASLAAMPLLAARTLRRDGSTGAAVLSAATGATVGGALLASTLVPRGVGLAQRAGLTLGDVWIVASAVVALLGRGRRSRADGS